MTARSECINCRNNERERDAAVERLEKLETDLGFYDLVDIGNRLHFLLTSNTDYHHPGCAYAQDKDDCNCSLKFVSKEWKDAVKRFEDL